LLASKLLPSDNAHIHILWAELDGDAGPPCHFAGDAGGERSGDPVRDFHVRLYDGEEVVPDFDDDRVAVYSGDHSYRCFHFNAAKLLDRRSLAVKVMALSGSTWVDFQGFGLEQAGKTIASPTANERWDATFDLTGVLEHDRELLAQIRSGTIAFDNQRLFSPFTTTLVEIRLDRDAYPLDLSQISNLFGWDQLEDIGNASPQPK
jgi:hypothetical protein